MAPQVKYKTREWATEELEALAIACKGKKGARFASQEALVRYFMRKYGFKYPQEVRRTIKSLSGAYSQFAARCYDERREAMLKEAEEDVIQVGVAAGVEEEEDTPT